jgi:IPT/TIG domain-containing protein
VWLGNKLAGSIVSWSNTQIVAVVAATAASGSVQVQQNGVWGNSVSFTVITPNVTSISPTSGYPGTQVTLNGTNFGSSQGSGSVWLGNKLAGSIVSWSNTQIVAVVAATAASGSASVQQGGVWSNSITFTVITPNITSISPTSGIAGTQVTITGTNFGSSQGSGSVWLGSKLAGSIVSWSNTQVVAVVDSGATTGNAIVQQGGVWSNSVAFTVLTPTLTSISPDTALNGEEITLTGTNFGSTQGSGSVWLGDRLAGSIVSWSNTQIVATIAAGASPGTAQVQQGGVWSNSLELTVIIPYIQEVSPESGPVDEQVSILGGGFGDTQGSGLVWLGTKYATVVDWTDTEIIATVASDSETGTAQVYQNGVWSNTVDFTVTPPAPEIISMTGDMPEGFAYGDSIDVHVEATSDFPIEYRFVEVGPYDNVVVREFGTSPDVTWTPYFTGSVQLYAYVRNVGFSEDPEEYQNSTSLGYTIPCEFDSPRTPAAPPEQTDRIVVDDETPAGITAVSAVWTTDQHTLGTSSFISDNDPQEWRVRLQDIPAGQFPAPAADQSLLFYALLDACNPPESLSVQVYTSPDWDHPVVKSTGFTWGYAQELGLPSPGVWTRFEVPMSELEFDFTPTSFSRVVVTNSDGPVWYDALGTTCALPADAGQITTPGDETTWFNDAPASGMTASGDAVTDTAYRRITGTTYSYRMGGHASAFAQSFTGATSSLSVSTGDSLFVYALFHECNMPKEVVVSWHTTTGQWKRAYWGKDTIYSRGYESETGFYRVGELPSSDWQMLDVSADKLGLEGLEVDGVKIETVDGLMWFQHFGIAPPRCPALGGSVGTQQAEILWFDDALPAGATSTGTWSWESSPVASGSLSHTDGFAFGPHTHAFSGATDGPSFVAGDLLSVWAQYSYCEPPREIIIGSGSNYAYWGEDLMYTGEPGATFTFMGPVPRAGDWRRLEIPASALGLVSGTVTSLSFGAYDGQVWFDRVSRMPEPAHITSYTLVGGSGSSKIANWSVAGTATLEWKLQLRNIDTLETTVLLDWGSSTTTSTFTPPDYGDYAVELYVRNSYGSVRDLRAFRFTQE